MSGFLLRNAWYVPYGRAVWEAFMPAGFFVCGSSTYTVPFSLFDDKVADLVHTKNHTMNNTLVTSAPVIVGSVTLRQRDGLYSLNDLHKASGGKAKHRPNTFLDTEHAKALVTQLEKAGIPTFKTVRSRYSSTYACAELAVAYAAWIGATFYMQVIRVFLGQGPLLPVSLRTLTFALPSNEARTARWLLDIDHQGKERCQHLSNDTHVLTRDRLVRMLIQNPADLHMTLEERLSILGAFLRNLSQAAALSARCLGIKPAQPPELITGPMAHIS